VKNFVVASLLLFHTFLSASASDSIYTSLLEEDCKLIERDEETSSASWICPGVGGYQLNLLTADARVSLTVIAPDQHKYPLDFNTLAGGRFSATGSKAEWRVEKKGNQTNPKALIVRLNVFESVEHPDKETSYLTVTKINGAQVCVTDKIPPGSRQNEKARIQADSATDRPCLIGGSE
jgi:hypothetical protein